MAVTLSTIMGVGSQVTIAMVQMLRTSDEIEYYLIISKDDKILLNCLAKGFNSEEKFDFRLEKIISKYNCVITKKNMAMIQDISLGIIPS